MQHHSAQAKLRSIRSTLQSHRAPDQMDETLGETGDLHTFRYIPIYIYIYMYICIYVYMYYLVKELYTYPPTPAEARGRAPGKKSSNTTTTNHHHHHNNNNTNNMRPFCAMSLALLRPYKGLFVRGFVASPSFTALLFRFVFAAVLRYFLSSTRALWCGAPQTVDPPTPGPEKHQKSFTLLGDNFFDGIQVAHKRLQEHSPSPVLKVPKIGKKRRFDTFFEIFSKLTKCCKFPHFGGLTSRPSYPPRGEKCNIHFWSAIMQGFGTLAIYDIYPHICRLFYPNS